MISSALMFIMCTIAQYTSRQIATFLVGKRSSMADFSRQKTGSDVTSVGTLAFYY